MIQMRCDGCDKVINRVKERWLGADVWEVDDDDEPADKVEADDYRFHYCSEACMSAWAFGANFGEQSDAASGADTKGATDG